MALRDSISSNTKTAMKSGDKIRVSTLRLISAAIKDRDIAARAEDRCDGIADTEILSLLQKMVRQREESAKTYEDNGRPELAERELSEIDIIREFMPKPLSHAVAPMGTALTESQLMLLWRSGPEIWEFLGNLNTLL